MLRRSFRLGRSSALHRVIRYGKSLHSPELVVRHLPNHQEYSRFAISISERAQKSSVKRNRLRRQLMARLEKQAPLLKKSQDYYITVKQKAFSVSPQQVAASLLTFLRRTH